MIVGDCSFGKSYDGMKNYECQSISQKLVIWTVGRFVDHPQKIVCGLLRESECRQTCSAARRINPRRYDSGAFLSNCSRGNSRISLLDIDLSRKEKLGRHVGIVRTVIMRRERAHILFPKRAFHFLHKKQWLLHL